MKDGAGQVRTVWLDTSLLMWYSDPRQPTGIPRTIAQIFRSLWARGYGNLRLFLPDLDRGGLVELPPRTLLARFPLEPVPPTGAVLRGAAPPTPRKRSRVVRLVRGALRRAWSLVGRPRPAPEQRRHEVPAGPLVEVGPSDLLLHLGGAWVVPGIAPLYDQLRRRRGMRIAHLIYDLIPVLQPHYFPDGVAPGFHNYLHQALRQSALLLSISRHTRDDLARYARQHGLPLPPVEVIRLGEGLHSGAGEAPPEELTDTGPFVLCVGTQEVRKNHLVLYQVWRRLVARHGPAAVPRLVIAGRPGWLAGDVMYQARTDPLTRDHIVPVESCDDGQLHWLYRHCLFTVYPSHCEGWGLPVAEALTLGKVCLVSNTSSLPEIAPALTPMADPCDAPAWQALVEQALCSTFRAALEARTRREFRRTSWDDTADQLVGYLDQHFGPTLARAGRAA